MRKELCSLLLLILTLCLVLLAVGCGDTEKATTPQQTTPPQTTPPQTTPPASEDPLVIFSDGAYRAALVVPSEPTALERNTINRIKAAVKMRTRLDIPTLTYAELEGTSYTQLLLVGETGHPLSVALYESLGERSARAVFSDGCLAVGWKSAVSAEEVVADLVDALLASSSEIKLPFGFLLSYDALPEAHELPIFSASTETISCGNATTMQVGKATIETFSAYCDLVADVGFELLSERKESGNLFATYRGETDYVYLYYTAYAGEIRIITGPLEELLLSEYKSDTGVSVDPYIASIPQPDNGQGYIIRLPDGRFIIQDGGYSGDDRVYATLRALVPEGKIVIAAYLLSHPHADHMPAFIDFVKTHRNNADVVLERVILNFGEPERYDIDGTAGVETLSDEVKWFYDTMKNYRPNVPVLKAHTGQIIDFGNGASIEILYTPEDLFPKEFPNINDSSLVVRAKVADTSVLLLADTCYLSGPILNDLWGDHLKSDVVQIAHHGQWPSVEEIYHSIKAEVVLYPAVLRRLSGDLLDSRWDDQCEAVFTYAKDLYVSGDEMQILPLPYTLQNNKDAMIEFITSYVEPSEPSEPNEPNEQ